MPHHGTLFSGIQHVASHLIGLILVKILFRAGESENASFSSHFVFKFFQDHPHGSALWVSPWKTQAAPVESLRASKGPVITVDALGKSPKSINS